MKGSPVRVRASALLTKRSVAKPSFFTSARVNRLCQVDASLELGHRGRSDSASRPVQADRAFAPYRRNHPVSPRASGGRSRHRPVPRLIPSGELDRRLENGHGFNGRYGPMPFLRAWVPAVTRWSSSTSREPRRRLRSRTCCETTRYGKGSWRRSRRLPRLCPVRTVPTPQGLSAESCAHP
jgi:hypothetical protein